MNDVFWPHNSQSLFCYLKFANKSYHLVFISVFLSSGISVCIVIKDVSFPFLLRTLSLVILGWEPVSFSLRAEDSPVWAPVLPFLVSGPGGQGGQF